MRSNLIKFDKPTLTNEFENISSNNSQKQSLLKLMLDKLSGIISQDPNKGLALIEQLLTKEEMEGFMSDIKTKFSREFTNANQNQSVNYNKRINTLKSCFEGLSADSIL